MTKKEQKSRDKQRRMVSETVDAYPYVTGSDLKELKKYITEMLEKHPEYTRLYFETETKYGYYDDHWTETVLKGDRMETDEELDSRLAAQKVQEEKYKQQELETLRKLQEKYKNA